MTRKEVEQIAGVFIRAHKRASGLQTEAGAKGRFSQGVRSGMFIEWDELKQGLCALMPLKAANAFLAAIKREVKQ